VELLSSPFSLLFFSFSLASSSSLVVYVGSLFFISFTGRQYSARVPSRVFPFLPPNRPLRLQPKSRFPLFISKASLRSLLLFLPLPPVPFFPRSHSPSEFLLSLDIKEEEISTSLLSLFFSGCSWVPPYCLVHSCDLFFPFFPALSPLC